MKQKYSLDSYIFPLLMSETVDDRLDNKIKNNNKTKNI